MKYSEHKGDQEFNSEVGCHKTKKKKSLNFITRRRLLRGPHKKRP